MKRLKKIFKWVLYLLLLPTLYVITSLILSSITIDRGNESQASEKSIYLVTNGMHLDVVIPINEVDSSLLLGLHGLEQQPPAQYFAFGWGDEQFYINTQYMEDLTAKNTVNALFLDSSTLMHVTRYDSKQPNWVEIKVNNTELSELNLYIQNTFQLNEKGMKVILENEGYSSTDDFYQANGSYSIFNTCNSWVNSGFKQSGLKASLWTPFDFGLMNKYE